MNFILKIVNATYCDDASVKMGIEININTTVSYLNFLSRNSIVNCEI